MLKKSHYHIHRQSNKYTTAQLGKYKKKLIISSIIKTFLTIEKKIKLAAFFLNSKIDLYLAYFFFEHITSNAFASYQNPVYLSEILWRWINVKIFKLKRNTRKIYLFCCRYLGVSSITAPRDNICNNFPGLVDQQKSLCLQNPQALRGVREGAKKAIYECQAQFSSERWNCTLSSNYSVFGHVLKKGMYCYFFNSY